MYKCISIEILVSIYYKHNNNNNYLVIYSNGSLKNNSKSLLDVSILGNNLSYIINVTFCSFKYPLNLSFLQYAMIECKIYDNVY